MTMNIEDRYDSLFQFYAEVSGLDWKDLKAQVKAESHFNPRARSMAGAMGLAQFMSSTFDERVDKLGILNANPYNPEDSIRCQADYMAELIDRYGGDKEKALAAYDWGMGNVDKSKPSDYPPETSNYIAKINNYRNSYGVA